MRSLWEDIDKKAPFFEQCVSGRMKALLFFQYGASLLRIAPAHRKFVFFDILSQTHGTPEFLNGLDLPLAHFLKEHLLPAMNDTMLWLMSDHGPKQGVIRQRAGFQAAVEFSNPLLSIVLPSWFASDHPQLHASLKGNQQSLTTPYDLHSTLLHLQTYPRAPPRHPYGRSLFDPLPEDRKCEAAGVPSKFCPCGMTFAVESRRRARYIDAMEAIMKRIRELLEPVAGLCYPVQHSRMHQCATLGSRRRGILFQIQTVRGAQFAFSAVFEVAVGGGIVLPDLAMPAERVTRYGRQPACISRHYPGLRPYCLCRDWKP